MLFCQTVQFPAPVGGYDAIVSILRIPKHPIALAWFLYRMWLRLPPAQRRQVMLMARRHGTNLAARAAAGATTAAKRRAGRP